MRGPARALLELRRKPAIDEMIGARDEARVFGKEKGGKPRHLDRLTDTIERMFRPPDVELPLRIAGAVHLGYRASERGFDGAGTDRSVATTVAPQLAKCDADAWPMPEAAPLTTTTPRDGGVKGAPARRNSIANARPQAIEILCHN